MNNDGVIMVVNRASEDAENLKELIQFMDVQHVCASQPGSWRKALGKQRLEALFVGSDLSDDDIDEVFSELGEFDPNVPIVMLNNSGARC